jgi:glycosyltransferase involved in cell wall biosynthesis
MTLITAVLHTHNDGLRLGRCLETLHPCDELLIVDHGSNDATLRIAREYGARVVRARESISLRQYVGVNKTWILCLDPRESITEGLAASLFEWKSSAAILRAPGFSFRLREETSEGWISNPDAQTRLVPADWCRWQGRLPAVEPSALSLDGELLRFAMP